MVGRSSLSGVFIIICVCVLIILCLTLGSFYTVDEGERGVLLTNGRVESVEGSGLHFKIPFFQTVQKMSTRTDTVRGPVLAMYSFDQQTAELQISVTYHVASEQIQDVYTRFGRDGIFVSAIWPRVAEVSKTVFGQFSAERAIQERDKLNQMMNLEIKKSLQGVPVVIENIQIENVDFSDTYERAVEEAARAKADVERAKSELARVEQEAQQKVKNAEAEAGAMKAKADAEAYSIKAKADAEAYSKKVKGEADAEVIRQRGEALRNNPDLIKLTEAEKWNGVLPTTMVPGSSVPFIGVK